MLVVYMLSTCRLAVLIDLAATDTLYPFVRNTKISEFPDMAKFWATYCCSGTLNNTKTIKLRNQGCQQNNVVQSDVGLGACRAFSPHYDKTII